MELREVKLDCPHCGKSISVMVDPISGEQEYTEDCTACSRTMKLSVDADEDGQPLVTARREEE